MSIISDIGGKLAKVPDVLKQYERELASAKEILDTEGKRLETLNRENPSWLYYFDEKKSELKGLLNFVKLDVDRVRSKLYKGILNNSSYSLTDRAMNQLVNSEDAYIAVHQIQIEVEEVYDKYCAIVKAFENRGFALRNMTELRVASLEGVEY